MSPRLPLLTLLAALIGAGLGHAGTRDKADIEWTLYTVSGASLAEVQDLMSAIGPQGYWAHTAWYVNWTGDCQISVTAQITLPELADNAPLDDQDVAEFERMRAALIEHELQHVDFGIAYSEKIASESCPLNGEALIQPYLAEERAFDEDTQHGRTQGVYLNLN